MRPRLNAGDDEIHHTNDLGRPQASMRPRLNAGDDMLEEAKPANTFLASMRPRLNAGDDAPRTPCSASSRRFNEAPAKCRG